MREALAVFVEAAESLPVEMRDRLRFELQSARRALKPDAGSGFLAAVEAARCLRDAVRRAGADETGGPKLKALVAAVDELDVF